MQVLVVVFCVVMWGGILKIEAVWSFETPVSYYITIRRHNTDVRSRHDFSSP